MTIQQLQYIISISETGSMNKTAEALYVSQPSITEAVKEVESELGFAIFNRTGKGVTLTADGAEFLIYAKQLTEQYDLINEKYGKGGKRKQKFCVSTQHYSFAVKAFVETVKVFDALNYEFALRETKTRDIIYDVTNLRSELGILYLNKFNRSALNKIFRSNELEFNKLIDCNPYVYLWKGHPLAQKQKIKFGELQEYPCLAFEQGDGASFYFAEELFPTSEYKRIIKACDRATMLNLMVGLNGYTLCSGIICEELNGNEFSAVPLDCSDGDSSDVMEIGYIVRRHNTLSPIGNIYISELKRYLKIN